MGCIRRTLIIGACCLMVEAAAHVPGIRADASPATDNRALELEARIEKLISQLGDPQYHAREKAQEELQRLGSIAFDALLLAQEHEDIEIAMRARYLVRSLPIAWVREDDSPQIQQLFRRYSGADRNERQTRIQHFGTLDRHSGVGALCRIMRFDSDRLLSKQAATTILKSSWPEDENDRKRIAKTIREEVAQCQRPAARWLLAYARSLEVPADSLSDWEQIVVFELDVLAKSPQLTSRDRVRDLLRWQTQLLLRLERTSDALATLRREFDLITEDREKLYELLDWCVDRELYTIADELSQRFAARFQEDPQLLYRLAESQLKRGQSEVANATAEQARRLAPDNPMQHVTLAVNLQRRMLTEWAEREYRDLIERGKPEDASLNAFVRLSLAELLFDWGKELQAAEMATTVAEIAAKSPQVLEPLHRDLSDLQGYANYYYGMHFARMGDREKQIEYFKKAIDLSPTNSDFLIAMYRVPNPDEAWRKDTQHRIDSWSGQLRNDIRSHEDFLQRPLDDDQRFTYGRELSNKCNELAWLLSNTGRDLQEALKSSQRSLELVPDHAAYLDTLGRCYYALNDFENAVRHQRRAVEKSRLEPQTSSPWIMQRQLDLFESALAKSKQKSAVEKPADDSANPEKPSS